MPPEMTSYGELEVDKNHHSNKPVPREEIHFLINPDFVLQAERVSVPEWSAASHLRKNSKSNWLGAWVRVVRGVP